jgi:hypothetical protein
MLAMEIAPFAVHSAFIVARSICNTVYIYHLTLKYAQIFLMSKYCEPMPHAK